MWMNTDWFKLVLRYVHERKIQTGVPWNFSATPHIAIMFLSLFNDYVLIADFN